MRIIAIEGVDGVGKTTLVTGLRALDSLSAWRFTGEFSSELGQMLHQDRAWISNSLLKMYFFAADRAQILAHLTGSESEPRSVVWDRYIHSAFVYREAERRLGLSPYGWVDARAVNHLFPKPDGVLFLEAPVEVAVARRQGDPRLLAEVAQCYEELWKVEGIPIFRLDAAQPPGEVLAEAEAVLNDISKN